MERNTLPQQHVTSWTPRLMAMVRAYELYKANPEWWNPAPFLTPRDYQVVCIYCDLSGDAVCDYILKAGVQGVSLVYHELAELQYYYSRGQDPILDLRSENVNRLLREQDYRPAHAAGLIREHRFLQGKARRAGREFNLCELVYWNPCTFQPDFDLACVRDHASSAGRLFRQDLQLRQEQEAAVYGWYWDQGFCGRYPGNTEPLGCHD